MQNKLQELTEKIYQEGVQRAKDEAEQIRADAQKQADEILNDARKKAEDIENKASLKSEEIKRNMEAEMKLASNQAISALKQQVSEMVTLGILKPSVSEVFSDKKFLQKLIETVVGGWLKTGQMNMNIILPEKDKEEMEKYFKNSLRAELNKGLKIEYDNQVSSGFKITPEDKSYLISFSDTDFINFFKTFLRPKTIELLFDKD